MNIVHGFAVAALGAIMTSGAYAQYMDQAPVDRAYAARSRTLTSSERALVTSSVASRLRDPYSAQFQLLPLPRNRRPDGTLDYCLRVNGKNLYGAYVGYRWAYVQLVIDRSARVIISEVRLMAGAPGSYAPFDDPAESICRERGI